VSQLNLEQRIIDLESRIRVLEAENAVRNLLFEYLYYMDVGYADELLTQVFTADAVLDVINFPPGTMQDLHFDGRDQIAPLYVDHTRWEPSIRGGHHAANVSVSVAPDCSVAHVSACFMTSGAGRASLQGGMYQGEAVFDTASAGRAKWRFRKFQILSGWGWMPDKDTSTKITDPVPAERAWWGARPARVT